MKKLVALLQDDMECMEIMRYILEQEEFEVTTPECTEVVKNSSIFDIVVVDEFAEQRIGCKICADLNTNRESLRPSILLTSTSPDIKLRAQACNADAFIAKPFDIDYFSEVIHMLLNKKV